MGNRQIHGQTDKRRGEAAAAQKGYFSCLKTALKSAKKLSLCFTFCCFSCLNRVVRLSYFQVKKRA